MKSQQKLNANHSQDSSNTSRTIRASYGTARDGSRRMLSEEESSTLDKSRRKMYTPLCLMERKFIKAYLDKGYSLSLIATELGRGKNSIVHEVRRNGGRDAYDPVKAQESATQRKIERDLKCSKSSIGKETNPYVKLRERIENLEMQLEIISETLKVLNRDKNSINNQL